MPLQKQPRPSHPSSVLCDSQRGTHIPDWDVDCVGSLATQVQSELPISEHADAVVSPPQLTTHRSGCHGAATHSPVHPVEAASRQAVRHCSVSLFHKQSVRARQSLMAVNMLHLAMHCDGEDSIAPATDTHVLALLHAETASTTPLDPLTAEHTCTHFCTLELPTTTDRELQRLSPDEEKPHRRLFSLMSANAQSL